jgi:hypothetical protein
MPLGIGEHRLQDAIATIAGPVGESIPGHSTGQELDVAVRVAFLLGEVGRSIRQQEPDVTRVRLIDARIINLVDDTMRDGEPHAAS